MKKPLMLNKKIVLEFLIMFVARKPYRTKNKIAAPYQIRKLSMK